MKLDLVIDAVARPWRPGAEILALAGQFVSELGPRDAQLQVVVTDDRTLHELNRDYRGADKPTDVLSFSYLEGHEPYRQELLAGAESIAYGGDDAEEEPLLGQILISIDTVRERGRRHADDEDGEVLFLMTHGLLHVLGFDHVDDEQAEEMESIEQRLFAPLRERLRGEKR